MTLLTKEDAYIEKMNYQKTHRRFRSWLLLVSWLIAGMLLIGLIIFGTYTATYNYLEANSEGKPIDGIPCQLLVGAKQHVHTYLGIYVDGNELVIPPGTGVSYNPYLHSECFYAMNVYSDDNIIHTESPIKNKTYTLGQFFDIWGETLSKNQVANYHTDMQNGLSFKIADANGNISTYTGDPRNIELKDHESIFILYNSKSIPIIPNTAWPSSVSPDLYPSLFDGN